MRYSIIVTGRDGHVSSYIAFAPDNITGVDAEFWAIGIVIVRFYDGDLRGVERVQIAPLREGVIAITGA